MGGREEKNTRIIRYDKIMITSQQLQTTISRYALAPAGFVVVVLCSFSNCFPKYSLQENEK